MSLENQHLIPGPWGLHVGILVACLLLLQLFSLSFSTQVISLGYDYLDDDPDPFPSVVFGQRHDHGTGCAGEIAMVKNNNVCGVGVAYHSSITGEGLGIVAGFLLGWRGKPRGQGIFSSSPTGILPSPQK